MAATTILKGNLTKAPQDFPNGKNKNGTWVKVTLADNRRDRDGNDLGAIFHDIWIYGYEADHFLNSDLDKGVRCFAEVRLGQEEITMIGKDGEEFDSTRASFTAIEFGPSTRWNPVSAHKSERAGGGKSSSTGTSRRAKSAKAEEADADGGEDVEEEPKARTARSSRRTKTGRGGF